MNKLILAAVAAASLTALPALPAFAQVALDTNDCGRQCGSTNGGGPSNVLGSSCDGSVSWLPRVRPSQVMGIQSSGRVWITPLCDDFYKPASEGNGAFLDRYIAQNAVLVEALNGSGYQPSNVYAVRMIDSDTINLFVYRRYN